MNRNIIQFDTKGLYSFFISSYIVLTVFFNFLSNSKENNHSNVAASLELNKLVSDATIITGETFYYTLQYRCASTTDNCMGTYISDPLPPEVEFISIVNSAHIANSFYDSNTHTVTFVFIDPLLSGTTGQVEIAVRFPNGNTPNGTVASNSASINATNAPQVYSNNVITTASAIDRIDTDKFHEGGALDNEMAFSIKVCNHLHQASIINGTINPSFITVRDTLPPNATFISTNSNGVYDPVSHSIEWTYPDTLPLGECWWPQVFVEFSSADYSVGDFVTNTAYITYTPIGGSPTVNEVNTTVYFENPTSLGGIIKDVHNSIRMQGESNSYSLRYWNESNIFIDDFYIEDLIPNGVIIDYFNLGDFYANGSFTNLEKTLKYTTNLNSTWTSTAGSPYDLWDNSTIYASDLGLAANEHITGIRWEFGPDPMPYSSGFNSDGVVVINFHVDNNAPLGDITNCITSGGADSTQLVYQAYNVLNCATFEVLPGADGFVPRTGKDYERKNCNNCWSYFGAGHFFNPGDTISFRLRVGNYNTASADITNPSIADFLPIGLTYLPGTWSLDDNGTGAPTPTFSIQDNYNGTNRELLTWQWSGFNLAPNEEMFIMFDAILGIDAPIGEDALINDFAILQHSGNGCNSYTGGYEQADKDDLDGDGDITELLCFSYVAMDIASVVSIESEKLVKGQLDTTYTKFPDVANSVPGGVADYILEIRNIGNTALDSIVVIDILPSVGDMGVIDLTGRDSRWRPNLVSTVATPPGVTVYYSIVANPCRSDEGFVASGPAGCTTPNWSTIPPVDLTTVQSLKFDFGSTLLEPQDTLQISWPMRVPVNVFSTIGAQPDSIAWNSFGFIGKRTDNGQTILPSEPVKVGINAENVVPNVYGDYIWNDANQNGIQDGTEIGIDGVRIELYKDDGDGIINTTIDTFINFTLTANGGYYLFPNLSDGDYYSVFYKPPDMEITWSDVGGDNTIDSDGVPSTINGFEVATSPIVTLENTTYDLTWDLGLYPSPNAAIGNYVWNDLNGNGIQDEANIEGINGVEIYLYDNNNPWTPISSAVTANDINGDPGFYLFDDVPPGNYFLEMSLPSGTNYTTQGPTGSSDSVDSDFNSTTNRTEVFSVSAGDYDNTWDGGLILSGIEVCDNGIDDNGDGLVDCLAPECPCYNPFVCGTDLYIANAVGFSQPSTFSIFNTSTTPFTLNPIGNVAYNVNAMGYRNQDNFIYGIELGTNKLIRIGADGVGYDLGTIAGLPEPINSNEVYDAGDVFPDGYLYVHVTYAHEEMYQIDVTTSPPQLVAIHYLDQAIHISDFAYSVSDDKLYGIGDNGVKYMINPSNWTVSTIGSSTSGGSYGAAYIDNLGRVFIYNNAGYIYLVDFGTNGTGTGDMTLISNAPSVYYNDGASCRGSILIPEICDNGIDDDGDGLIDRQDSDCCGARAPVLSKN